jgi:uncharacterized protein (TIGR03085 family)
MTRHAQSERESLADLLLELGPDAPTLCEGWKTRDLAAHLIVRERRMDASAGIVLPWLRGWGERVRAETAQGPYDDLVGQVRAAPWWSPVSNPLVDWALNTTEFYIHHEDVRRAQPGWQPRDLPRGLQEALWTRVPGAARLGLRRVPADILVQAPGYGEARAGGGGPKLRLVGSPGELILFLSGRQRAARVQIDGPADLAERLRTVQLGL